MKTGVILKVCMSSSLTEKMSSSYFRNALTRPTEGLCKDRNIEYFTGAIDLLFYKRDKRIGEDKRVECL